MCRKQTHCNDSTSIGYGVINKICTALLLPFLATELERYKFEIERPLSIETQY